MKSLTTITAAALALVVSAVAAPAMATFGYAPLDVDASIQGGGEANSTKTFFEDVSTIHFDSISVVSTNNEFVATNGFDPSLPPSLKLMEGTENDGKFFTLEFNRTSGPAPTGQTGFLKFVITNTDSVIVNNFIQLQQLIMVFTIDIIDDSGTYNSPTEGIFALSATSASSTTDINYNFSIVVPGTNIPTESPEPATLALVGAGLAVLGFARRRR